MRTKKLHLYVWKVLVLLPAGSGGRTKDMTMRWRVIARNQAEAEQVGIDLAELGGHEGELLAQAVQVQRMGSEPAGDSMLGVVPDFSTN